MPAGGKWGRPRQAVGPTSYRGLRLVDDDAATVYHLRGGRIYVVRPTQLVIIDQAAPYPGPDLDPELVGTAAARLVSVCGSQHETVIPGSVDLAAALVLSLRPCNHKPLISGALEVQVAGFELELGVAGRHVRAMLVLRDEPE